mmetsp:Transcript_3466/g.7023  ORF Transcript_3466/g.7023 Transcript_3466/m.7023 type:complete len:245 (-) Transcript_3466:191-925(-)
MIVLSHLTQPRWNLHLQSPHTRTSSVPTSTSVSTLSKQVGQRPLSKLVSCMLFLILYFVVAPMFSSSPSSYFILGYGLSLLCSVLILPAYHVLSSFQYMLILSPFFSSAFLALRFSFFVCFCQPLKSWSFLFFSSMSDLLIPAIPPSLFLTILQVCSYIVSNFVPSMLLIPQPSWVPKRCSVRIHFKEAQLSHPQRSRQTGQEEEWRFLGKQDLHMKWPASRVQRRRVKSSPSLTFSNLLHLWQ